MFGNIGKLAQDAAHLAGNSESANDGSNDNGGGDAQSQKESLDQQWQDVAQAAKKTFTEDKGPSTQELGALAQKVGAAYQASDTKDTGTIGQKLTAGFLGAKGGAKAGESVHAAAAGQDEPQSSGQEKVHGDTKRSEAAPSSEGLESHQDSATGKPGAAAQE